MSISKKDIDKIIEGSRKITEMRKKQELIARILRGILRNMPNTVFLEEEVFGELSVSIKTTLDGKTMVKIGSLEKNSKRYSGKESLPLDLVLKLDKVLPDIVSKLCKEHPEVQKRINTLISVAENE